LILKIAVLKRANLSNNPASSMVAIDAWAMCRIYGLREQIAIPQPLDGSGNRRSIVCHGQLWRVIAFFGHMNDF
jgi:hypothetical protein